MVGVVRRRRRTGVRPHRHHRHRAGGREGGELCLTVVDVTAGHDGGVGDGDSDGGGGGGGGEMKVSALQWGHSGHQVTGRSVRVY